MQNFRLEQKHNGRNTHLCKLIGQNSMTSLDDPRHQQKTGKRDCADPEQHAHGSDQRVRSHRRDLADDEWSDSRDDAARVVAEPGTGRAQASWKKFGQVVCVLREPAEMGHASQDLPDLSESYS